MGIMDYLKPKVQTGTTDDGSPYQFKPGKDSDSGLVVKNPPQDPEPMAKVVPRKAKIIPPIAAVRG